MLSSQMLPGSPAAERKKNRVAQGAAPFTKLILNVCLWNKPRVGENAKHASNLSNAPENPILCYSPNMGVYRTAAVNPLPKTNKL